MSRLTGKRENLYEIFVEDELARTIVQQLCIDNGIKHSIDIIMFGPVSVGIKSAFGMITTDPDSLDNTLFVIDGDKEYYSDEWYSKQAKSFFQGDDPELVPKREKALNLITRFNMPDNKVAPEEYYRNCILGLNRNTLSNGEKIIFDALNDVVVPVDTHDYFKAAIEKLGFTLETGTSKIVDLLKKTNQWQIIVERVQLWIDTIKTNIIIPNN